MIESSQYVITPKASFKRKVKNLAKSEWIKVKQFITLFKQGGFRAIDNHFIEGYKVRNKPSTDINTNDPLFYAK